MAGYYLFRHFIGFQTDSLSELRDINDFENKQRLNFDGKG